MSLKVFSVIDSSERKSSVDMFRAIAILGVVVCHFNSYLPYGFLGVDLFFVISGLLVGGILTKNFKENKPVIFWKFILQRGFKIWPSYYTFLIAGNLICYFLYRSINNSLVIPWWDMKRYLFFYQNYTGVPFHTDFFHVWSLCVEEHFYILLPVLFIVVQHFFNDKSWLFTFTLLIIAAGITFKFLSYYYTGSKDTLYATHNRIDALAWGVLLNLIIVYNPELAKKIKLLASFFLAGILLFILAILFDINSSSEIYHRIILNSLVPFCFSLMILGLYYFNFTKLKALRIIAYYSYNWYLWHPLFVFAITYYIGSGWGAFLIYLAVTFMFAFLFTVCIEEPFLKKRNGVLLKIFKN